MLNNTLTTILTLTCAILEQIAMVLTILMMTSLLFVIFGTSPKVRKKKNKDAKRKYDKEIEEVTVKEERPNKNNCIKTQIWERKADDVVPTKKCLEVPKLENKEKVIVRGKEVRKTYI